MRDLFECVGKTGIATIVVWLLASLLRNRSAAFRHSLWVGALVSFLVIPVAWLVVGNRHGVAVRLPAEVSIVSQPAGRIVDLSRSLTVSESEPQHHVVDWWFATWFLGVALLSIRRLRAILRMRGIARRAATRMDGYPDAYLSAEIPAPMSWGFLKPAILLPLPASDWSKVRLDAVMGHEREHVRRGDTLSHWLGEVVCIGWWFHPLAWLARDRAAYERECACDDAVLRSGVRPSDYAAELLSLIAARKGEPEMALSAVSKFEQRMTNLLRSNADRSPVTARTTSLIVLALLCALLPLAMLRAQLALGQADLVGTVSDASRARIPGGTVIAAGSAGNREITRADAAGAWSFHGLTGGHYTIEIRRPGFAIYSHPIDLAAGQRATLDATLSLGSVQETIDVVAQGQARKEAVASSGEPQRIRVGGNVQATKLLTPIKPVYPDVARSQGIEGTVLLHAVIGIDGNLLSLSVMNKLADPDLAAAAMDAVRHARYQPTLLNGQPVEIETTITVNFRLQ